MVSFYTLKHIPREDHKAVLRRICKWLRVGGFLLISMEAGDNEGVMGEWLSVPMLISCYDPETMKQMVNKAGFELLKNAIEIQLEGGNDIPYLWVFGQKR